MGYENIMKKYWKRIIIVIIVMIYIAMLVSAVIVNIKYRKYVSVTELGMSETYDYELYKVSNRKGEWTVFWSIESDNGWRNNTRLQLYRSFHQSLQEGEHQYIFPYVINKGAAANKKKTPQEWKYKLQINKTPVVYVNLG